MEASWNMIVLLAATGVFAAAAGASLWSFFKERLFLQSRKKRALMAAGAAGAVGIASDRRKQVGFRLGGAARGNAGADLERHVPEMIDALGLGMRAGMSFERAFRSYCFRFDDELALMCRQACLKWESGLVSRDEALLELGALSGVSSLERFASNSIRCLRFGSPMNRTLDALAGEARSCYRAKMEEKVAKAPVKMLVPTAALILPAMLIVVMAPVFLGFVQ